MINLLPATQKEQVRFAKLNRVLLTYVRVTVAVVVVLAVIFAGTFYFMKLQAAGVAADVEDKKATLAELNRTFVPKAKEASNRLNAIKYVQGTQTRFSAVIDDLADVVPKGVSIDTMTLTGEDKTPVKIGVTASSYAAALEFRNALITSSRVAAADLETITSNTGGTFQASIVIAFKPGQAK